MYTLVYESMHVCICMYVCMYVCIVCIVCMYVCNNSGILSLHMLLNIDKCNLTRYIII